MTSLASPFSYNLASPQWRRDAILHETASRYGAQSQQHIQENQLAPQLYPERSRGEQAYDHSTPLPFVLPYTHPNKEIGAELEDIHQERHLIQQTQQRVSSDLVELKALRAEMRQLVEAVQSMQGPSSLQTSKLMQSPLPGDAPEIAEDDDWPAPPPWPDPVEEAPLPSDPPVLIPHRINACVSPAIKTEAMAIPPANRFVDHPGQSVSPDPPPALKFPDKASHNPPPWFKPVHLPPRSGNFPLGGSKHPRAAYGDSKTEHDCNPASPEQQFNLSSAQPLPDRPNLGRTSIASETVYYGPRPMTPNFSSRDPSEFAKLKMALGNLLPEDATELFKYQVLVDHLHLEEARLIADAYLNSTTPFTDTMEALNDKFGQPHQIVLRHIAAMMDSPDIRRGDVSAFERFALQIQPRTRFKIAGAFTAARIGLAGHTYPMEQLRERYKHLIGLPIHTLINVKPLLLIGSDHPHLVTPVEPVRLGPPGGPAAIRTRLGWALQVPASIVGQFAQPQQCLLTTVAPQVSELMKHVEKLWQVDIVPFRNEKVVTRSRQNQEAIRILETRTVRVEVEGIFRYATPLLRRKGMPILKATKDAVMPSLRGVERRLAKDPERAEAYKVEMEKLIKAGSIVKCGSGTPATEGNHTHTHTYVHSLCLQPQKWSVDNKVPQTEPQAPFFFPTLGQLGLKWCSGRHTGVTVVLKV
ncbi:unnamed protein product [Oreochromis niloticus]|nr:unnamed protein product [Mustela putorius furo]